MRPRKVNSVGRHLQLHRAFSKLGWGSRRQAWDWIRAGQVQVDGRRVTDPLAWVDLDRQQITREGAEAPSTPRLTLALHKPRGVVTTRRDERGRPIVYDLLPPDLPWIFPAGRLDADSEGLLILTNDAALAVRLTEPEHHVPKTYHVTIKGEPDKAALAQLRKGVRLKEGFTRPVHVRVLDRRPDGTLFEMVLTEGRNRQIRRMWTAVGHRVRRLVRVAIGNFSLGDLAAGAWKHLNSAEIGLLTAEKEIFRSRGNQLLPWSG